VLRNPGAFNALSILHGMVPGAVGSNFHSLQPSSGPQFDPEELLKRTRATMVRKKVKKGAKKRHSIDSGEDVKMSISETGNKKRKTSLSNITGCSAAGSMSSSAITSTLKSDFSGAVNGIETSLSTSVTGETSELQQEDRRKEQQERSDYHCDAPHDIVSSLSGLSSSNTGGGLVTPQSDSNLRNIVAVTLQAYGNRCVQSEEDTMARSGSSREER